MTVRLRMAALRLLAGAAIFFSSMFAAHAAWIPLKAKLAQALLQVSWDRQMDGVDYKPWPWADTHAVALLSAPRLGIEQIVLEGESGRNLAFGPVLSGSNLEHHDWIINGHRDTHFRFLKDVRRGDELRLETTGGTKRFRVQNLEVIDSRMVELVLDPGMSRLSLVTCYPFDAATTGGPLRYVVTALPLQIPQEEPAFSRPVSSSR